MEVSSRFGSSGKLFIKIAAVYLFISFTLFFPATVQSEEREPADSLFRIIFYNVENLFDIVNDPFKADDDFTPEGARRWTSYRLRHKVNNIYKALAAAGGWEIPAIIGLCEVENMNVLEMITRGTGFNNFGYRIIHRNSADHRGIDVAVLFHPGLFTLLDSGFTAISFPFDTLTGTRDIVYLKGTGGPGDTLHFFVNHWPSRWGGQAETEIYRTYTASVLRSLTDSVLQTNPYANIIIMGDFNDEPHDPSLKQYLGAGFDYNNPESGKLYNISHVNKMKREGTIKFQGEWFLFDQFIVSGTLLDGTARMQTCPFSVKVFSAGFLLVPDEHWFGCKPFRTYEGFRYTGGFSDHLPVVLDLYW